MRWPILTEQVTAPSSIRVLTVGVGPTFADPLADPPARRLSASTQPDIDVRITTGGAAVPFGDDWTRGMQARQRQMARPGGGAAVSRRPDAGLRAETGKRA